MIDNNEQLKVFLTKIKLLIHPKFQFSITFKQILANRKAELMKTWTLK